MTDQSAIIARINALFAKAESTEFAAEAEALAEKAQELLTQYSISRVQLDEAKTERIETRTVPWPSRSPGSPALGALSIHVAKANNCVVAGDWLPGPSFNRQRALTFSGYASDVAITEMLYTSLAAQMETAYRRSTKPAHIHGRTWRTSFYSGFASRIGQRLEAGRRQAEVASDNEHALVLVQDRYNKVKEQAGHTGYVRRRDSARSHEGFLAGSSSAQRADIGQGRLRSQRELS